MAFVIARRYPSVLRRLVLTKRVPLARRDVSFVAGMNRGLPSKTAPVTQILPLRLKNGFATAKESAKKPAAKKTEPKATGNTKATKKSGGQKSATKKPNSGAKKRKVLTPEQKAERKAEEERLALFRKIKALKADSLEPPKRLPATAHRVAFPGGPIKKGDNYFAGLSDSDKAKFQEKAEANDKQNKIAYEKWVKSLTPLEVRNANLARATLRRLKYYPRRYAAIKDDRQVKPIRGPFTHFIRETRSSGELDGMMATQSGVRLGEIWRSLTETEKNKYRRRYEADIARYEEEYRRQYHEEPPRRKHTSVSS